MVKILDHGYLEFVESWGSDKAIIEAARMSTDKGFLGWGGEPCPDCIKADRFASDGLYRNSDSHLKAMTICKCKGSGKTVGDEKLLAYLWNNKHATPFEMAGMVIEVQAPIMVFREWHRHRTQSYNEMSARYVPLPDLNYVPSIERLMINSKTNKQAGTIKGADELDRINADAWLCQLMGQYDRAEKVYQVGLQCGVPKELARLIVPVGRYSKMRASANLRNWLGFLTLRMAPGAQWEIRQYANEVGVLIKEHFPRTWELFCA